MFYPLAEKTMVKVIGKEVQSPTFTKKKGKKVISIDIGAAKKKKGGGDLAIFHPNEKKEKPLTAGQEIWGLTDLGGDFSRK